MNINTINDMSKCIDLTAHVLRERASLKDACMHLFVPEGESKTLALLDEWLEDLKMKASLLKWDAENKKLKALEAQLKNLRSQDAKTEDALSDITKLLGV